MSPIGHNEHRLPAGPLHLRWGKGRDNKKSVSSQIQGQDAEWMYVLCMM